MINLVDQVERYHASSFALRWKGRTAGGEGSGGGLEEQMEQLGLSPLVTCFEMDAQLESIELHDGGLEVKLWRRGDVVALSVRWPDGTTHGEELPVKVESKVVGDFQGFVPDVAHALENPAGAINDPNQRLYIVESPSGVSFYGDGHHAVGPNVQPLLGVVEPAAPLGPAWFRERLGLRANYIGGAMAGGIASEEMVIALAQSGLLGVFGAGGLPIQRVSQAIDRISGALGGGATWGFNLLHNPFDPAMEWETVELYVSKGVTLVSAAAFMGLTPALVRYRFAGARRGSGGEAIVPNRLLAKISRPEVAIHFLRPPSEKLIQEVVERGGLTTEEAEIARVTPMADGLTVEGDSGGHTDHRPLPVVLPAIRAMRDGLVGEGALPQNAVAVGAAGGIGTPQALYGAFQMGAEYVVTGSVNQSSLEAGTSPLAKEMLAKAGLADVASGIAPDMFEMGAHVQILSRGSMYAKRSYRLYDAYKTYDGWEAIPEAERGRLHKILGRPFDEIWGECLSYWGAREPAQVERAEREPRHKMALVFRWYLGMASRWARLGERSRKKDFQIWCGPAMGGFNEWVKGSSLEPLPARNVVAIADALLLGASVVERCRALERMGVSLPAGAGAWRYSSIDAAGA